MADPHRRRASVLARALDLRWRLAAIITLIAVAVLGFGAWRSYEASIPKARGQFLGKHYNRFDAYRHGLGRSLAATAEFIAADPNLVAALSLDDHEAAGRAFSHAVRAARRTVEPQVMFLFDRGRAPVPTRGATTVSAAELSQSALVSDLAAGTTVVAELAIIGDQLYQVSGAPVRNADETVVGAIVIGHDLERYFHDYREQSDPTPKKQHRLTIVNARGEVLASVFPSDAHGELADALKSENRREYIDGRGDDGELVNVASIELDGTEYDFWEADARGYHGGEHGELGSLFMMRTRAHKQAELREKLEDSLWDFLFVGAIVFLIGLIVAWWITRRINSFVYATEDLAKGEGDLTKRLDVRGTDELARLAENLNDVFAYTHDLAAKVQSSAFQVGASSAEISAASQQMLDGAQEQARKTESSTAAVTELSASIQQVAENAMEATRVARSSGEAVQDAIGRMNEIRATVDEAAARIQELGESGKRIGNIVEVIRQISDQTTLLALNAAIEAAHAGEQGRGFAVVADEVSGLAKRVGQSARDIEDLIATIKEQTVEAVRAMDTGTREVEAGTTLVTNTLSNLHTLVGVVEDTAKAVQEQAVASDEIARNMDVVQRIAQDVLGSSEEAVSQGEHLHRLAHELEQSVKGFRISKSAPSQPRPALPAGDTD